MLKNDGTLPFKESIEKIVVVGPWANATVQMQGNYYGVAPALVSPYQGTLNAGYNATYIAGTTISGTSRAGFADALAAARRADAIVFAGGIDESIEREGKDRTTISWPGVQLALVEELAALEKPLVVIQFGGGQVDNTVLKTNSQVRFSSFDD